MLLWDIHFFSGSLLIALTTMWGNFLAFAICLLPMHCCGMSTDFVCADGLCGCSQDESTLMTAYCSRSWYLTSVPNFTNEELHSLKKIIMAGTKFCINQTNLTFAYGIPVVCTTYFDESNFEETENEYTTMGITTTIFDETENEDTTMGITTTMEMQATTTDAANCKSESVPMILIYFVIYVTLYVIIL